jgi:hypothetical protein
MMSRCSAKRGLSSSFHPHGERASPLLEFFPAPDTALLTSIPPWQFLHGELKKRSMKGTRREASFRVAFVPDKMRALYPGKMTRASH